MLNKNHNPDVLSCLANLSNDEVFTAPSLVNDMLDLLPKEIWQDKEATFLDPSTKTGVFLREIAKRLMVGLKEQIANEQERVNHILSKQIFAIAITELTSLLARRSLYCSKIANNKYSICEEFEDEQGNIIYEKINHSWKGGKCKFCGASQGVYDRDGEMETHAYQFIHSDDPKEFFAMKFDVIVGNPPYQMGDGGAQASAKPIYHKFVQQAKKLNPRYLSMIIPARWFSGGKGLDKFRDEMLKDDRLRILHDFTNARDCFANVKVEGGICYFLWDRDKKGLCEVISHSGKEISSMERSLLEKGADTFIRYNGAVPILNKVASFQEKTMDNQVSSAMAFGFRTFFSDFENEPFSKSIKLFANQKIAYVKKNQITKNISWLDKHKVLVSEAYGMGNNLPYQVLNKPFYAEPNSCCTETYIVLGLFDSEQEAKNLICYIKTRFFRFLVLLKKNTQHTTKKVYSFVPIQDFSERWSDEKLYKKYGLSDEEVIFIESMVRPMELDNE